MDIVVIAQIISSLVMLIAVGIFATFAFRALKLRRIFSKDYVKIIQRRAAQKLYPLVPREGSPKYKAAKKFIISIGWGISVEDIYLRKWSMFAAAIFILVTIQTTNKTIELQQIVEDVNYNHTVIETLKAETPENIQLERELYNFVNDNLKDSNDVYNKQNRLTYIEQIKGLLTQQGLEREENLNSTAQRLYYKVLQTKLVKEDIRPYIYIFLIAILSYHLPDILGQIKRKLIEDKKNWEILNCMIVFSIFGRMPPYSVQNILEHMEIATEVYKPLFTELIEGIRKGGKQEEVFNVALEAVDRDELYELIETMKLAKNTGLVNSVEDIDENINNAVKWIEIENITRRRTKMLYAMSAVAIVMALGCIYFAYALTVISNPTNMLMK